MTTHETTIQLSEPLFRHLGAIADEMGLPCYAVGGYVRDRLLGRACKDIDIMVVGEPISFAKTVKQKLNGWAMAVFERFRTAQLTLNDSVLGEVRLEFVGARKESYNPDSRKPITAIGTLEDDLMRRDFTVNALAVSLNAQSYGELVDLFGGLQDLERKTLRTPLDPEATFSDDPLRMMRAARFAAQLGFQVDSAALAAMEKMRTRIKIVSQERITDELLKIMKTPVPSIGLEILFRTKLLEEIFPELTLMAGVEQVDGLGHKDTFYHTLKVVDNCAAMTDKLWLRMAALLHDIGKPRTKRFIKGHGWSFHGHDALGAAMLPKIFKRMKFPMEPLPYVQKLVRMHLRPIPLHRDEITDSAIRRLMVEAGEDLDDLMLLCRADVTSKNPKKVQRILANFAKVEEKVADVAEKDKWAKWRPPINGHEIMEMFQIPEGKLVGILKKAMENAILDGQIPHEREAAIAFLRQKFEELKAQSSPTSPVSPELQAPAQPEPVPSESPSC
ncbi:MAG: HD domain-containing protein [Chloroherpetonaceae bacterium]|nr:CCA tRNA nucleotidyltransferase [Chloroherpetonaceae bacterium]MCS7211127.1 CCA tRNA nucleotidyltransferase [Chloroherpetonaceae bacterium]MDW8019542.1 HD domain-containing protein [Chloroherpetonaceae bacterium]